MKRNDYIKMLKDIGFQTSTSKVTELVYATCNITPMPYKDERGYKIIPHTLVVCNMGGVNRGENQGCISCTVRATVKRPYGKTWNIDGEVHKYAFVDDGKIDVRQAIKDWLNEFEACKRDWEYLK